MKEILKKIYHKLPIGEKTRSKISDYVRKRRIDYKPLVKEKFLKTVRKYDIISFDIFDTLISRIVYNPDDLFLLIGEKINDKDFLLKRKNAENTARNKLHKDVNINEIYACYEESYKVSTKEIKKLEIELEENFCIPRKEMLDVFKKLVSEGKEIILTSDMYLPKSVIETMLKKCGFEGYKEFYLSNYINKRKDTKEIWSYLKDKYKSKKIIHIGDNYNSDYLFPKEFGIDALKIASPRELFSKVEMYKYVQEFIDNHNINDAIGLGLFVNKITFNSPFSTLAIDSVEDLGYIFHGPILLTFLEYIVENQKDNELLFLAREGYYLQKLYKYYCQKYKIKENKNVYFLASRKATITANVSKETDLQNILNNDFKGSLKDYFKQLLDYNYEGENFDIELPRQKEEIFPILQKHSKEILDKCKKEKDNYLAYIKKELGVLKDNKVSIIDLGYSGTIQYELSKLTGHEFRGYYLVNSSKIKKYSKDSQLYFLFNTENNQEFEKIYHYSLILEYFLSAPYGQLIRFNKKGSDVYPVYNDEKMDDEKVITVTKIFDSVVNYIDDFYDIRKYYNIHSNINLLSRLYSCIVEGNLISKKVKDEFDFVDSFSRTGKKNVFKIISRY